MHVHMSMQFYARLYIACNVYMTLKLGVISTTCTRVIKKTFEKMKEYVGIYIKTKKSMGTRLGWCLALATRHLSCRPAGSSGE